MKKWLQFINFILFLIVSTAFATEVADNQIKNALHDIQKYEQQFAGSTQANPSTIKRTLKLLTLTRQRLDSSPNQSHASWQDADARYTALVNHLNQMLEPAASSTNTSSQAKPAAQASTPKAAASEAAPKASASGSAQMISQYRVRIKKIDRDIKSLIDTIDKAGVKPFQDPEYVKQKKQSAANFQASIDKYADFKNDPDVVTATNSLATLNNMLQFGEDHAAKELAELGDVQARLKEINGHIRGLKQPATPAYPYPVGSLEKWLVELATLRQSATQLYEPLPVIKERAYLPNNRYTVEQGGPYDFNDVDRLERSLIDMVKQADQELELFKLNLNTQVSHIEQGFEFFEGFDPTIKEHRAKHYIGEGRADEVRNRLATDQQVLTEAVQFSKLIKAPEYDERVAMLDRITSIQEKYESDHEQARSLARMPEAASKDKKLIKIAKETLANYDYIGDYERLVINADKVHRSKETSTTKFDDIDVSLSGDVTLTGTETTYFYEWDQFQVATAEPKDGRYYIFYNTLKFFTSGSSNTPLNKWILSGRIQGIEIQEENIKK